MKRIANIGAILSSVALLCFGCAPRSATDANNADSATPQSFAGKVINVSDSLIKHSVADTLDFGRINSGEVVEVYAALRNSGDTPFVIISGETGCGCTTIDYPKEPIKPGEQKLILLKFDSKSLSGWQLKLMKIRTSLASEPIKVYITAQVE